MPAKELQGGCHCGNVRYQVPMEISDPFVVSRCNCTMCIKSGWTPAFASKDSFKLTKPGSEKDLLDYSSSGEGVERHRLICPKCAIPIYGYGFYTMQGKRTDFFAFNSVTLDMPQDGLPDSTKWKFKYWDGRHDNWMAGHRDEPFEGGIV